MEKAWDDETNNSRTSPANNRREISCFKQAIWIKVDYDLIGKPFYNQSDQKIENIE